MPVEIGGVKLVRDASEDLGSRSPVGRDGHHEILFVHCAESLTHEVPYRLTRVMISERDAPGVDDDLRVREVRVLVHDHRKGGGMVDEAIYKLDLICT